jgi:4-amino-4-deoxy-L-arabinose transferase-like glycosyltransferase
VCALTLGVGLGRAALWEPDEARFAEASRQMIARGDVLTPWFNDAPRFEKPILFYWLQLPFVAALGGSELAARLPGAMTAMACVGLVWLIGMRLFGATAGCLAALMLATSFRFVAFSRQGLTDIPALVFQLVAMHAFVRLDQDARARGAWITAWLAVGLAALTKGPVAIIPIAVWGSFYALRREWEGLRRMRLLTGLLVAAAVAAPWGLYMLAVHGVAFVQVAFMSEVVARVRGTLGPARGLLYYFDVWPADLLPWTPFFLAALVWLAGARRRLEPAARRNVTLALVWFACVLLLFSLSSAKLPHYLLPAHPAAALVTALFIERTARSEAPRGLWWAGAALVVLMLVGGGVLVWALLRRTTDASAPPPFFLPALLAIGALGIVLAGRLRGPLHGSLAIAATTAAAVAYTVVAIVPALGGLRSIPEIAAHIAANAGPHARVGQYGAAVSAGLVYYTRRRVDLLNTPADAAGFLRAPGEAYLVLPRPDADAIAALAPDAAHEMATSSRLVVRLDRLFGDRSPYEDGLVVLANGAERAEKAEKGMKLLPSPPSPPSLPSLP